MDKQFLMINNLSGNKWMLKLEQVVLYLLLFSVFLFPSIKVKETFPSFQVSDILLPLIIFFLLLRFNKEFMLNKYVKFLISFCCYIFLTIIINQRLLHIQDYYEILKLLKFIIIFLFVALIIKTTDYNKIFRVIFFLLLVFNFVQYTDLFNFNKIVEPYYAGEIQLDGFGVNSLGEPDTKRTLGTTGNPNTNAILFLFFMILFIPQKSSKIKEWLWFSCAYLGFLSCQSRTGIIALILVVILTIFLFQYDRYAIFLLTACMVGVFLLFHFVSDAYLASMAHPQALARTHSVMGRLEVWNHLWQMIKQKPILGHAPYKEYFYENKLYSESEYVLMTWRYGFIGLFFYLTWLIFSLKKAFRKLQYLASIHLILFSIVILITAITNNPLNEPRILLMLAIITGLFYSSQTKL